MFEPNVNCNFEVGTDLGDSFIIFAVKAWMTGVPKEFAIVYRRAGYGHGQVVLCNTNKKEIDELLYACHKAAYKAGFAGVAGEIEEMIGRYSK